MSNRNLNNLKNENWTSGSNISLFSSLNRQKNKSKIQPSSNHFSIPFSRISTELISHDNYTPINIPVQLENARISCNYNSPFEFLPRATKEKEKTKLGRIWRETEKRRKRRHCGIIRSRSSTVVCVHIFVDKNREPPLVNRWRMHCIACNVNLAIPRFSPASSNTENIPRIVA